MAIVWLALGAVSLLLVLIAASRVAALAVPSGLLRAIAAATLTAATLVLHALVLGRVSWGASPVALAAAAAATYLVVRVLTPRPEGSLAAELVGWIGALSVTARALLAVVAGATAGWLIWLWRWPYVGPDGQVQNLLEISVWIHGGRPGSEHRVFGMAPIEAFPMTNDVLVTWAVAFARSFAVIAPWAIATLVLLAFGMASVLHSLEVPRKLSTAAIACVITVPHVVALTNTPKSDLPALAWLACCAALALGARSHPRLLAFAVVAGALSVGSKTTTAPLVVLVLLAALWGCRRELPRVWGWLVAGVGLAVAVGGIWYVRNTIDHGSPVWPLGTTPWGDPLPPLFQHAGDTFLQAPRTTFQTQAWRWTGIAGAALVLPLAGVAAGVLTRRAAVRWLAVAGLLALGLWAITPVTGLSNDTLAADAVTSTTRYLLPAAALGAVTLAVWATGRRIQTAVVVGLWALTAYNLVLVAVHHGWGRMMPSTAYVILGGAVGGGVSLLRDRWRGSRRAEGERPVDARRGWLVPVAVIALVVLGVAVSTDGWVARHRKAYLFAGQPVEKMLADPRWADTEAPVYVTNIAWSDLVGDRLDHEVTLLLPGISCQDIDRLLVDGWLVLIQNDFFGTPDRPLERGCLKGRTPLGTDAGVTVFAPTG